MDTDKVRYGWVWVWIWILWLEPWPWPGPHKIQFNISKPNLDPKGCVSDKFLWKQKKFPGENKFLLFPANILNGFIIWGQASLFSIRLTFKPFAQTTGLEIFSLSLEVTMSHYQSEIDPKTAGQSDLCGSAYSIHRGQKPKENPRNECLKWSDQLDSWAKTDRWCILPCGLIYHLLRQYTYRLGWTGRVHVLSEPLAFFTPTIGVGLGQDRMIIVRLKPIFGSNI